MKITDKRLLIIDKDGDIFSDDTTIGKQHQEILDDFAKSKHYDYSNVDYITKKGNVVFYNVDHNFFATYAPESLTDEQIYQLELLDMHDVSYMEVRKNLSDNKYCDFTFDKDDFDTKTALLNSPKVFKEYGKEEVLSRLVQFPKSVLKEFMDLVSESQLLPSLIDVPTLIVQGSADIVVPLKSSEALYDEIKSKKKKIIVLDNVTHDIFRSSEVDSLCIKIKDFLNDKD